mgnify:CR=1 FL=1
MCGLFLADNERVSLLIHNFQFWCKYNKFIIFLSKKWWKSFEIYFNKCVDILTMNLWHVISVNNLQSYSHSYPQVFNTDF